MKRGRRRSKEWNREGEVKRSRGEDGGDRERK